MTFEDKHFAMLDDLQEEFDAEPLGYWKERLGQKIEDLIEAIKNLQEEK